MRAFLKLLGIRALSLGAAEGTQQSPRGDEIPTGCVRP